MMRARFFLLLSVLLALAFGASPADASRRCGNELNDGRFIVQGPLVDAFGEFCSLAVIPRLAGDFSSLVVIDGAQFSDEIIILSPPFTRRPHRFVVVDSPRFEQRHVFAQQRFAPPAQQSQIYVPFNTGSLGPLTTGTIGPLTTFSNSPPASMGHR
jgi:hypothetical protein